MAHMMPILSVIDIAAHVSGHIAQKKQFCGSE